MSDPVQELQQLKGVGAVMAQRLVEAELATFSAIVQAGEEGLRSIPGINHNNIPVMLAQAATLSVAVEKPLPDAGSTAVSDVNLKAMVEELRTAIQSIATVARDRFPEELADNKLGRKLTRNMVAGLDALYAIEELLERRPKRSRKALAKARKRLEGLADAEPDRIKKGLKRARKALEEVMA